MDMSQSPVPPSHVAAALPVEPTADTQPHLHKRSASELLEEDQHPESSMSPADLDSHYQHPPKRQHVDATNGHPPMASRPPNGLQHSAGASQASHPHHATSDDTNIPDMLDQNQLRNMDSEDLIQTIIELQTAYSQNLATISSQYDDVSRQLDDMRNCLLSFFRGTTSSYDRAAKWLRNAPLPTAPSAHLAHTPIPVPPSTHVQPPTHIQPPTRAQPPTPAPVATFIPSSSQPAPSRPSYDLSIPRANLVPMPADDPPPSTAPSTPASATAGPGYSPSPAELPFPRHNSPTRSTLKIVFPADGGMPSVTNYSTLYTVRDVWAEYKYGLDGVPPIEVIEGQWGSRWRPEPKGRTWFSRRKIVWDKVRELIHDGLTEEAAVSEVENMRAGRSMNWLINVLTSSRRETKASWKAAAAAATAAKHAGM